MLFKKYNRGINLENIDLKALPNKIGIATTVQFAHFLEEIKEFLEKNNKTVGIGKGIQKYAGQVLGCEQSSTIEIEKDVDGYLYIGDGRFHPTGIAYKTKKTVCCSEQKWSSW